MKEQGVKERIMETASRLFYFKGYNQTGINQIIEEAGVAKSSMYQHYRSKEDIAVIYLQRRHAMWFGELIDFVADKKHSRAKILASFDYINKWLVEVNFRGCSFQNIIADLPKGQERISNQVLLHKNELKKWIQNILKEDPKFKQKSEELSNEVMVLVEGAIILSQIQKDAWPISSAKNACKKILE